MSKNKLRDEFFGDYVENKKKQQIHHENYYRGRHRIVMLGAGVNILTLTNSSDVSSWTDIDVSGKKVTGGTGDISDDTIALILLVSVKDTASATNNTYMAFKGGSAASATAYAHTSHINNQYNTEQIIVPINSSYILQYQAEASGASTLTGIVNIVGYIEQIS